MGDAEAVSVGDCLEDDLLPPRLATVKRFSTTDSERGRSLAPPPTAEIPFIVVGTTTVSISAAAAATVSATSIPFVDDGVDEGRGEAGIRSGTEGVEAVERTGRSKSSGFKSVGVGNIKSVAAVGEGVGVGKRGGAEDAEVKGGRCGVGGEGEGRREGTDDAGVGRIIIVSVDDGCGSDLRRSSTTVATESTIVESPIVESFEIMEAAAGAAGVVSGAVTSAEAGATAEAVMGRSFDVPASLFERFDTVIGVVEADVTTGSEVGTTPLVRATAIFELSPPPSVRVVAIASRIFFGRSAYP